VIGKLLLPVLHCPAITFVAFGPALSDAPLYAYYTSCITDQVRILFYKR